jgi:hypothetical protein
MGRAELAEAVNTYIWRQHGQRRELDARTIARYERGTVRWPNELYREAFRTILHATDSELGFVPNRRRREAAAMPDRTLAINLFSPFDPASGHAHYFGPNVEDKPIGRVGMTEVIHVRTVPRRRCGLTRSGCRHWPTVWPPRSAGAVARPTPTPVPPSRCWISPRIRHRSTSS